MCCPCRSGHVDMSNVEAFAIFFILLPEGQMFMLLAGISSLYETEDSKKYILVPTIAPLLNNVHRHTYVCLFQGFPSLASPSSHVDTSSFHYMPTVVISLYSLYFTGREAFLFTVLDPCVCPASTAARMSLAPSRVWEGVGQ